MFLLIIPLSINQISLLFTQSILHEQSIKPSLLFTVSRWDLFSSRLILLQSILRRCSLKSSYFKSSHYQNHYIKQQMDQHMTSPATLRKVRFISDGEDIIKIFPVMFVWPFYCISNSANTIKENKPNIDLHSTYLLCIYCFCGVMISSDLQPLTTKF